MQAKKAWILVLMNFDEFSALFTIRLNVIVMSTSGVSDNDSVTEDVGDLIKR